MTFLSTTDAREREQNAVPYDPVLDSPASWDETFDAAVGGVFDEGLSVSTLLNREGYSQRQAIARQMRADGFDFKPYTDEWGVIDYNRLAEDTDAGIKTDRELFEERNDLLARRRAYSEDVIARGSGVAQFTGSMTGYMLDPINVATLPIGASASALRGLSTVAAVRRVAMTEAAIAGLSEAAIQPLVFAHKNEIGSPYELDDALRAIGTAAMGGAAFGGAVAGVAGFVRRMAKLDMPDAPEVRGARESLSRFAADLEANPRRAEITAKVSADADRLNVLAPEKLDAEVQRLRTVARGGEDITQAQRIAAIEELEIAEAVLDSRKGRWSKKIAEETADELPVDRTMRLQEALSDIENRRLVDEDIQYARTLEETRRAQGETTARADQYELEEINADELDALEEADLARYEALEDDGVVFADGEAVSARAFIDERAAEIEGLESVRTCAIG